MLAESGLGRTWPNPSVGCVIVKNDKIIASARTADGGRPHAETIALEAAGIQARGATMYTTLQPCDHIGKTPSCAKAIVSAGIAEIVYAIGDPTQSDAALLPFKETNVRVVGDFDVAQGAAVNEAFLKKVAAQRPFVTTKIATTLDSRIATKNGESQWITGPQARKAVHEMRARHDAIMVGIGTVLADDPSLTVRDIDQDDARPVRPVRIVIDRDLQTPVDSRLVESAKNAAVWLICSHQAGRNKGDVFRDNSVEIMCMDHNPYGFFHPQDILKMLGEAGLNSLFIEGGGFTMTSFMKAQLIDRLVWMRAPKIMGNQGIPAFGDLKIDRLDDCFAFDLVKQEKHGQDLLEIWEPIV